MESLTIPHIVVDNLPTAKSSLRVAFVTETYPPEVNGVSLTGDSRLTIHAGHPIPDARVSVGPRIGITKAADWPLRYLASSD